MSSHYKCRFWVPTAHLCTARARFVCPKHQATACQHRKDHFACVSSGRAFTRSRCRIRPLIPPARLLLRGSLVATLMTPSRLAASRPRARQRRGLTQQSSRRSPRCSRECRAFTRASTRSCRCNNFPMSVSRAPSPPRSSRAAVLCGGLSLSPLSSSPSPCCRRCGFGPLKCAVLSRLFSRRARHDSERGRVPRLCARGLCRGILETRHRTLCEAKRGAPWGMFRYWNAQLHLRLACF